MRVLCANKPCGLRRYRYSWKVAEAEKNVLRTHTTAVSSRMLYKLAQEGFRPAKYFSIDRVFRNEAVDRTHLAEFHQIEGEKVPSHKVSARCLQGPACVLVSWVLYGSEGLSVRRPSSWPQCVFAGTVLSTWKQGCERGSPGWSPSSS